MIKKLFGETEEEQFRYLKPRLLALGAGLVLLLVGLLLDVLGIKLSGIFYGLGEVILVVTLLIFGWSILRGLFGITTIGVLFSNNVVLGLILFILYIMFGYIGGLIVAVVGLCRFFVLIKNRK